MPMEDEVPMAVEEGIGIIEEIVVAYRLSKIDKLMISIVIRVYFVYGFYLACK
jgi:hypothetical protein